MENFRETLCGKVIINSVITGLLLFTFGCAEPQKLKESSDQKKIEESEELGVFIKHSADCRYPPKEVYSTHGGGAGKAVSSDGRWHALKTWEQSIHEFNLYDLENKKNYLIYHPNVEVALSYFSFDTDSKFLTFIGGPRRSETSPGLSEVFTINLQTLKIERFGAPLSVYEYPVSVDDGKGLLFFESPYHLGVKDFSPRLLASQPGISRLIGYRDHRGSVTYLKTYSAERVPFAPLVENFDLRDDPNRYEEVWPLAIRSAEKPGQYYVYNRDNRRIPQEGKLSDFNPFWIARYLIEVSPEGAVALEIVGLEMPDDLRRPLGRPDVQLDKIYDIPQSEQICLEIARLK